MTMGTNDFSAPAGPTFGSITGPAPSSVAGSASDFVKNPAPDSIARPALNFIIGPALGVVAGCVTFVVINPTKDNYFYGKQVTADDLTSSKLYIKRTIWIRGILFGETSEAWNFMLGILNDIQRAKVAKDLGH